MLYEGKIKKTAIKVDSSGKTFTKPRQRAKAAPYLGGHIPE